MAKKAKTELVVIQPELKEIVKSSNMDLSKAEQHAMAFVPLMVEVNDQTKIIKGLNKENPEHAAIAKRASLDLGKILSRAGDVKKERKADLLLETKHVDNLFNLLESTGRLGQSEAKTIFTYAEEQERIRLDSLETSRLLLLEPFGEVNKFTPIREMDDETFDEFLKDQKLLFEAKQKQIEEQKKADDLAAEEEKKKLEELQKSEDERKAREQLYRDRLAELLGDGFTMSGDNLTHGTEVFFSVSELGSVNKKEYDSLRKAGVKKITAYNKANEARLKQEEEDRKKQEQEAKDILEGQYKNRSSVAKSHLVNLGFSEYPENEFMKHDAIGTEIPFSLYSKLESDEMLNEFCADCSKMMNEAIEIMKKAEARKNELAPDKDKIVKYANEFNDLVIPEMKTKEGKLAIAIIEDAVKALKSVIKEQYIKLK